jgi:hypothetical protein
LAAAALLASQAAFASDSQFWSVNSVSVKLSSHWSVSQDLTLRFSDEKGGLYEVEANSLAGYRMSKNFTLWAGYDFDPQYSHGDHTVTEHRIIEQGVVDKIATIGGGKLNGRLRFEQRWRDGMNGTGWRLRPYLRYALPISGSKVAFVLSDEQFWDLGTNSFQTVSGLERMRNFIGLSVPVTKTLGMDAGYMNQHHFVPNGKDSSDNIAYVSLGLKL